MKKATKTTKITTRGRILNAALKVFSHAGYSGSTTLAIAKAAGVNEVTLFRHFGSKQQLFAEIINRFSAIPFIDAARQRNEEPIEDRFRELAGHVMHILEERKDLIAILLSEGPKQSRQAKAILEAGPAQVLTHLAHWFHEAHRENKIKKVDPECAARAFMGMFFMFLVFQKILPGDELFPVDPQLARDTFLDIFLHGVLPKEQQS
ncbi:MAG: TetR/AcrR family transcriptional regulator [Candidatus Omnitrophota bacterium]|jgi:AcrR family transcriptional regulator|nr:MAG: TetR/AcrR family transcriptional regulator [Candidatus Omnitrophota bacterium]